MLTPCVFSHRQKMLKPLKLSSISPIYKDTEQNPELFRSKRKISIGKCQRKKTNSVDEKVKS